MKFRIEVSLRARADAAYAWMAEKISPAFAEAWYRGLFEQIETLSERPARCPVATESDRFAEELRELIYGTGRHKNKYRILFTVRGDSVTVLYVHHSSRKGLEP